MTEKEIFDKQVVPIMTSVKKELQRKQVEEVGRLASSPAYILSSGIGIDGGMSSQWAQMEMLKMTGEWNSKTVEDYVEMVKAELRKHNINVTPAIDKMMIDKMVRDEMPKSTAEYILRKAASNTIFGIPNELRKSPLQKEIDAKGEELYNPSKLEKGVGWGLGATADFLTLGGPFTMGVGAGVKFVGVDLALNATMDALDKRSAEQETAQKKGKEESQTKQTKTAETKPRPNVPLVIAPGHEEAYLAFVEEQKKRESNLTTQSVQSTPEESASSEKKKEVQPEQVAEKPSEEVVEQQPEQTAQSNTNGWQGLLSSFGLNGISDVGRNAGYILAMLPDMLLGMFTGKSQALGIKDNLMPIASIVAGMFIKNPLLKMTLITLGGANLLNKGAHEELAKVGGVKQSQYRQYGKEPLNPRIDSPILQGNTLVATIDRIPVTVRLPDKVVDAYNQGALPLSTLANAVLARTDQMQTLTNAQQQYENETREVNRPLAQR